MIIAVCGKLLEAKEGYTLGEAIRDHSPYGEEMVIVKLNGEIQDHIHYGRLLKDGDDIQIYPLIIGG